MATRKAETQEQQLEAAGLLRAALSQIEDTRELLWSAQTDVCALLVIDQGLPIAEVARVAGVHRHTVTKKVEYERWARVAKTEEELATRIAQIQRHVAFVTDATRRID